MDRKLGKDALLKEYRNFPHGIWSFDVALGIDECKFVTVDFAAYVSEFVAPMPKPVRVALQSEPPLAINSMSINLKIEASKP